MVDDNEDDEPLPFYTSPPAWRNSIRNSRSYEMSKKSDLLDALPSKQAGSALVKSSQIASKRRSSIIKDDERHESIAHYDEVAGDEGIARKPTAP